MLRLLLTQEQARKKDNERRRSAVWSATGQCCLACSFGLLRAPGSRPGPHHNGPLLGDCCFTLVIYICCIGCPFSFLILPCPSLVPSPRMDSSSLRRRLDFLSLRPIRRNRTAKVWIMFFAPYWIIYARVIPRRPIHAQAGGERLRCLNID